MSPIPCHRSPTCRTSTPAAPTIPPGSVLVHPAFERLASVQTSSTNAARRRSAPRARRRSRRGAAPRPPRRASARRTGTRPRTRPTCGRRRPARRGRRRRRGSPAAPVPAASRAAATSSPAATSSGTETAMSCRIAGYVITSSYVTGSRAAASSSSRSSSNAPHSPSSARGCTSPTTPAPVLCGLARMEQRVLGALERRLRLERGVQRLDDALRVDEAALGDPGDADALVGELAAREVHARDLEQRDPPGARVDVPARRLDEAREERRPQRGQLDRDRLGELPRRVVVEDEARRVRLGEAEPDERVLDAAPELLLARERAEHLAPRGQRERHVLEPEARDLLDDVDLARDVAGAPRRRRRRSSPSVLEAEPAEERVLLVRRRRDADHLVGALGPEADRPAARAGRRGRRRRRSTSRR